MSATTSSQNRSLLLPVLTYSAIIGTAIASIGIGIVYHSFSGECKVVGNRGSAAAPPVAGAVSQDEINELKEQLRNRYMSWNYNWDGLHDAAQQGQQQFVVFTQQGTRIVVPQFGSKMRHLFLVRHGQYNLQGVLDNDRFLTELGREQAALTGLRLAAEGHPFKAIHHSTMRRAIETADIIQQFLDPNIPITADELLSEGLPIIPEPNELGLIRNDTLLGPDGFRMEKAFRKYFHRAPPSQVGDSYELVVCHANMIRYLICRALQVPPEAWMRFSLRHASITWVTILPNGGVLLRMFGDAGYMPVNKLTE